MAITDTLNLISMDDAAQRVAEMLDATSWAKDFSWPQMLVLGRYFKPYAIQAGLLLFDEGSKGGSMGILIKGSIDIYKANQRIATLNPGRTYGEMSLIDHQPRSAKAIVNTDSELLIIDQAMFERLSDDHPRLALRVVLKIAYFLSQNLRKTSGELSDLLESH
ncbi:MAG: cyclic nucleotide-binding domain-containing protein [Candidatus Competibacteraceae bacterium]|nr:MAG: cyclic nucleotide-binding domain-containing protein [Candidatus Competibacteraceae bacterium]